MAGISSSSRTTAATSSTNMVPRTWARYSATRYMAASWVAKVLVAATHTSGPARVYSTASDSRGIEAPTVLDTVSTRARCRRA